MRAYGWFGLVLLLTSEYFLFRKIEPFYSWFYCFAWWSYILLADNLLLKLRGRSLIVGRRRELWSMLPLSVAIWLLFEGYNLSIRNWAYSGVPGQVWVRWPGYSVAFATVLPGIFITADLFDTLFFSRTGPAASEYESLSAKPSSSPSSIFLILGVILSVAPLVSPRFFFPTVWLGPIFLLDPLLEKFGIRSLSLSISSGDRRRVWSLLLSGLTCGLMWEFWNFWAGGKWIYSVPFFDDWRIFEMPLIGFLGFPPFALECWILYHLLTAFPRRWNSTTQRVALWLTIGLFCIAIFHGIDRHTVLRFAEPFRWSLNTILGVSSCLCVLVVFVSQR
jgi:hypothetical protein